MEEYSLQDEPADCAETEGADQIAEEPEVYVEEVVVEVGVRPTAAVVSEC